MTTPSLLDLHWLKLHIGKKAVWAIVDSIRPDSTFRSTAEQISKYPALDPEAPIPMGTLPPAFYRLFCISPDSSPRANQYYNALSILAQSFFADEELCENNLMCYMAFATATDAYFSQLLEKRDERALLILSYWYVRIAVHTSWRMRRRSLSEGQSICMYLTTFCGGNADMMELLEYPKDVFGRMSTYCSQRPDNREFLMHSSSPNEFDDGKPRTLTEKLGRYYRKDVLQLEMSRFSEYTAFSAAQST